MEAFINKDLNNINVASTILEAANTDSHETLTIYPDLDTLVSIAESSKNEKQPIIQTFDAANSDRDEEDNIEVDDSSSNSQEHENNVSYDVDGSSNLNESNDKLKCNVCFCTFNDELKFKLHVMKHQQSVHVDCNYCGKKIAYNRFVYHVMIHTGERPHVCEICCKGFRLKRDLKQHMFTHTGEKPYPCDLCGRKFADTSSRRKHFQIHTGERPYSCDLCQKSFTQISHLREHQVTHTKEKSHTCELCLKKFTTKSSMQRHMLTHDNTCEVCNCTFTTNNKLQKHRELHDAERPFSCPICLRRFRKRTDINTHMLIHSDEKNVICNLCNEAFKSYRYLRVHYASSHKGVGPPFRCNICFKRFFQEKSIKQHYSAHLSDSNKRAKCPLCSITFSCSESLKKHSSHKNCDILNCLKCDSQFENKSDLVQHLKTIHDFFSDNLIVPDIKHSNVKRKSNDLSFSDIQKNVEGNLYSLIETSNNSTKNMKEGLKCELNHSLSMIHKTKLFEGKKLANEMHCKNGKPTIVKVEVVSDVSNTSFSEHDDNSSSSDKYSLAHCNTYQTA